MENIRYPKYRWFVVLVMTLTVFSNAAIINITPSPIVGEIARSTGWQLGTATAIIMGSFTFFVAIGCILTGFMLDIFGIAKTYLAACVLSAVGSFIVPIIGGSVVGMLFIRLLQGLGGGMVLGSAACVAGRWFPAEERGIVTGVHGAGIGLGVSVGLAVSPAVFAATGSWTATMALMGIAPSIGIVLSLVLIFGPKAPTVESAENAGQGASNTEGMFQLVLKEPLFYLMIAVVFCFSWVQQGYNAFIPGYLSVDTPSGLGMGALVAGSTFSVYSLAFMLGALFCGFINRYIFKNNCKACIAFAFIVSAILHASVLLPFVNASTTTLFVCFAAAGFFFGWCSPLIFAYLTMCYPIEVTGRVGGITQGIGTLGATVGVSICSIVLNITGRYFATILIFGTICLINFVLTFFFYKPNRFTKA